jgi:DNA invertase Pin-like site-specific DNA recombinase
LPSLGVGLFLHQEGIDTTTLAGKAMFQMMGEFAEFERSMIVVRSRVRRRPRCWGAITSISRRQSASTLVK